ncbi:MAG: pseudouridine synthase [Geobacter sp.]|nr:MAG: pseudouridine synthase [Geobacter sp.]
MGISRYPSRVTLPQAEKPYPSILCFLAARFPSVARHSWEKRIAEGKVLDEHANPVTLTTAYEPYARIFYFREVSAEPVIPFTEKILFQDDEILVACKPHFLPVTPGGRYVDECLLNRLRRSTGIHDLAPLHRIDRETAGIVLFSVNRQTRGVYGELFLKGQIEKTYEALSACTHHPEKATWRVEDRIVRGEPWFRMKTTSGTVNARSTITLVEAGKTRARFLLHPVTGKTHQLRVHMSGLGFGILNDRYYPELQPETDDDFDTPLQLLAKAVRFHDPVTGTHREFISERELME